MQPIEHNLNRKKTNFKRNVAKFLHEANSPHTQGVELMLSKGGRNGPKIIKVSSKTKKCITINIIQCYAPTNESGKDDINFMGVYSTSLKNSQGKSLTILMKNLNTTVGIDNTRCEDITERHGLRERKENDERLTDLYAFNNMDIGRRIFPHTCIQKDI